MKRLDQPWPLVRPSLAESVTGLLLTETACGVAPTEDEADAAEVIRHVDTTHRGSDDCDNPDEPDPFDRTWGTCSACAETWPCKTWADAHCLAVLFTGRAHNRYRARAVEVLARIRDEEPE